MVAHLTMERTDHKHGNENQFSDKTVRRHVTSAMQPALAPQLHHDRRRHHRRVSSAICVLYPIKASQSLPYFRTGTSSLQALPVMARWRCNAAIATAFNLPSDMWRSRPSRIAVDMKVEAIPSALSRALLGGKQAQSMWVKAEQSNIRTTSDGCAMAGLMMASSDRAAAITRFIQLTTDTTLR